MKWLKIIILILSLVPIEFIGLFTDYQTGLLRFCCKVEFIV